jgi:hypothetical protein
LECESKRRAIMCTDEIVTLRPRGPALWTIPCPRCGTPNDADAQNCGACRINLAFARENPAKIERVAPEDAGRARLRAGAGTIEGQVTGRDEAILLSVLLLLASFALSFCLGEAVHEFGHFLAHRAYGSDVGIRPAFQRRSRVMPIRVALAVAQTSAPAAAAVGPDRAGPGGRDLFARTAHARG